MGASLFSNYLLAFIADNLDDFLVGKHLGKVPLGLYNRAFMISSIPVKNIAQNISQVLVASFSKIQKDKKKPNSIFHTVNFCKYWYVVRAIRDHCYLITP